MPLFRNDKHRPTMFHTATVRPRRSGPRILYNTPLTLSECILPLLNLFIKHAKIHLLILTHGVWPFKVRVKRDFAGGPQNQKMTMPDDMSSQLIYINLLST